MAAIRILPGWNPIIELSLSFHNLVVGANGQRQAMFLENISGLADRILRNFDLSDQNSALVVSSSGCNVVPIEMAELFQKRGNKVVAIVSSNHLASSNSKCADGKKLSDFADIILDTGAPPGDAMVCVAGLDTPVAPGSTVAVRVADLDPTDFEQLGAAKREGRRQAFIYEKFFQDCVPGFGQSHIIGLSHHIGVRETRRVYGEYRLTRDDCMNVARFDDRVLLCGAPMEDHRSAAGDGEETAWAYVPGGQAYDVPYRTLVPKGREELWVVGRCFSSTHDAHASCRSMAQTMARGRVAGMAAALSLETSTTALNLSVSPSSNACAKAGHCSIRRTAVHAPARRNGNKTVRLTVRRKISHHHE